MILNYDPSDCLTPEEEAEIDARYAEEEVENWLASWSDDFNSDEWLIVFEFTALQSIGRL